MNAKAHPDLVDLAAGAGPNGLPLVSCIMPTYNRRPFVPQAISYFLRQEYPDRELIVIDDGTVPVADLIPSDPRIRYVRLDRRRSLGMKHNLGCRLAQGEIIAHWDDDDWSADWRLRYQVQALVAQRVDICGLAQIIYYDQIRERAWRYVYPERYPPWVGGNTLCYTRRFWRKNPFPDLPVAVDNHFLWSPQPKTILTLPDQAFFVGLIHPGNTSPKQPSHALWQSYPIEAVQDLMGSDWSFYAARAH